MNSSTKKSRKGYRKNRENYISSVKMSLKCTSILISKMKSGDRDHSSPKRNKRMLSLRLKKKAKKKREVKLNRLRKFLSSSLL